MKEMSFVLSSQYLNRTITSITDPKEITQRKKNKNSHLFSISFCRPHLVWRSTKTMYTVSLRRLRCGQLTAHTTAQINNSFSKPKITKEISIYKRRPSTLLRDYPFIGNNKFFPAKFNPYKKGKQTKLNKKRSSNIKTPSNNKPDKETRYPRRIKSENNTRDDNTDGGKEQTDYMITEDPLGPEHFMITIIDFCSDSLE